MFFDTTFPHLSHILLGICWKLACFQVFLDTIWFFAAFFCCFSEDRPSVILYQASSEASSTIFLHASCKLIALRLNHNPDRSVKTSWRDACAKSKTVGHLCIQSVNFCITLETCVCCSITSETSILYVSCVFLHGKSLLFFSYHPRTFCWNCFFSTDEIDSHIFCFLIKWIVEKWTQKAI